MIQSVSEVENDMVRDDTAAAPVAAPVAAPTAQTPAMSVISPSGFPISRGSEISPLTAGPITGSESIIGVPDRPPAQPPGALSLDTVLSPYVGVFCAAFLVAYLFTPIMRIVAVAYGIVDQPDRLRKIHHKPVAYLGGVAVFLGFVAALAISQIFTQNHNPYLPPGDRLIKIPLAFIVSTCVIVALGLLDDLRGVRPSLKIIGQIAAGACLLAFGIGTHIADQFIFNAAEWLHLELGLPIPAGAEMWLAYFASAGLVLALVVFCCNASNLMDGLDGLCGGITALIAAGLIFVTAYLAMTGPVDRAPADAVRLIIALALFGAVLGFLPFNFNPASIFMGDTGSLLMGFVIATSIILLGEVGAKWMLGALVMFSLPVLDTALAVARRYVNHRPLFAADRHHFHHQLVSRGLSIRRAVVVSYVLTVFFVASGCLMVFLRTRYVVAFYLVLFGSIIVTAYKMGMVHERPLRRGELEEADAEAGEVDEVDEGIALERGVRPDVAGHQADYQSARPEQSSGAERPPLVVAAEGR